MPSRRVMPCMAALPDGTYLIANGAKQGVAGFGLSDFPNLDALLYDTSKPVGQRISDMANTTVVCLYHSKALTLLDGRVFITGSNPQQQDGKFPQEYCIEVFMPLYLLSGLPCPTFDLTNRDWTYGQVVSFTLTSGSTANLRASIAGADSRTHGNLIGQRTISPDVSCAGNTCTVIVPPSAHVALPGWHKFFVLDGPTPSVVVHIHLHGDPAAIDNWPSDPKNAPLPGI